LLFKVTNMFTKDFTLCNDVIRLPWQLLFIEHGFVLWEEIFKFLAQTYPSPPPPLVLSSPKSLVDKDKFMVT